LQEENIWNHMSLFVANEVTYHYDHK